MAAVSLKVADIIKQYDGEWLKKLELVATLQKITHLENFVPLFLSGSAFAVYEALDGATKQDFKKLKVALCRAFSVD